MNINSKKTGGTLLVECLLNQGSNIGYAVPGESYLGVLDALYDAKDKFDLIICRQEGSLSFMAEAHGRLTGKPGIGFVTRGPGAANAVIGVQSAHLDGTPMILFVGQVPRKNRERNAFQELDLKGLFGSISKLVMDIDDAARIPEIISRAYRTACSGRPGPVVIGLPDDMQLDVVEEEACKPVTFSRTGPSAAALVSLTDALSVAQKPLVLLGAKPSTWSQKASDSLRIFIENQNLPIATVFRRQDQFDNNHPNYVGVKGVGNDPKFEEMVSQADTIIVIGAEITDIESNGYTKYKIPNPEQRFIHISSNQDDIGNVFQPELSIVSDYGELTDKLSELLPVQQIPWADWVKEGRKNYEAFTAEPGHTQKANLSAIIKWLDDTLEDDTLVTFGAGNYTQWVQRYFTYNRFGSQMATQSAVMGYSVPAAISASLNDPARDILSFAGDGCFLMNGQELATAARYNSNVKFIVINNSLYGSIQMHQEKKFPNRSIACSLTNPNFAKLAEAYNIPARQVFSEEEFILAYNDIGRNRGNCLIEIITDPQIVTPSIKLSDLREGS